jgi:hypothetical protein
MKVAQDLHIKKRILNVFEGMLGYREFVRFCRTNLTKTGSVLSSKVSTEEITIYIV